VEFAFPSGAMGVKAAVPAACRAVARLAWDHSGSYLSGHFCSICVEDRIFYSRRRQAQPVSDVDAGRDESDVSTTGASAAYSAGPAGPA
jgi:hypothetical protein